eukprot:COSAG02_NODE_4418_length_5382_cov_23.288283_2_plen_58_part_00
MPSIFTCVMPSFSTNSKLCHRSCAWRVVDQTPHASHTYRYRYAKTPMHLACAAHHAN